MCGVVGFVDFANESNQIVLDSMSLKLQHRGPDSHGSKLLKNSNRVIGLAHRRLSIIELTDLGNQPMCYNDLIIVFNGEIYNHNEIRQSLIDLKHVFNSGSDTEVILHAFDEWGFDCISLFIGMFSIVIYDSVKEKIYLIRDRIGVKPLFYYWDTEVFMFSSELKSFTCHHKFKKVIDNSAVRAFFEFGYIPGPKSIFHNTFKLEAGHILEFDVQSKNINITKYWDVGDYFMTDKLDISYSEAKKNVHDLLVSSYNYRMVSDVPVGIFLSGGYDSTSVAAILKNTNPNVNLKTFTIGFDEGNNEAPFAKKIANYLGTDHNEWYCSSKIAKEEMINLSFYFDEPFADSSAIPTLLLSKHVKSSVSVSLSADGGDEIFGGYKIYNTFLDRYSQLNSIPNFLRKNITQVSNYIYNNYNIKNEKLKHKIFVLSNVYNKNFDIDIAKLYKSYTVRNYSNIDILLKSEKNEKNTSPFDIDFKTYNDLLSVLLTIDSKLYLCDDILTKVDRATMAYSLEGREPMLDHRLIEYVAKLPSEFKKNKKLLKDIVHEYVPENLMNRPKSGFSIPLANWLRGDLKFLLNQYLDEKTLKETNMFNLIFVQKIKFDFLNGSNENIDLIWRIIQFQMWFKNWINND